MSPGPCQRLDGPVVNLLRFLREEQRSKQSPGIARLHGVNVPRCLSRTRRLAEIRRLFQIVAETVCFPARRLFRPEQQIAVGSQRQQGASYCAHVVFQIIHFSEKPVPVVSCSVHEPLGILALDEVLNAPLDAGTVWIIKRAQSPSGPTPFAKRCLPAPAL